MSTTQNRIIEMEIEKSLGNEATIDRCFDTLEKAMGQKGAPIGEIRTWGGKEYVKTPKGWRPKPKGYKEVHDTTIEPKQNNIKSDSGGKVLPSSKELYDSRDGSTVIIKNAQTGNTVISYIKRDGKWFSSHSMTRGEIKSSPEQMLRTLEGYNRKTYSIKFDLRTEGEKKGQINAPGGVDKKEYEAIVSDETDGPSIHILTIDGTKHKINREIDRTGGQHTVYYQLDGKGSLYWDLDRMISDYRKDNSQKQVDGQGKEVTPRDIKKNFKKMIDSFIDNELGGINEVLKKDPQNASKKFGFLGLDGNDVKDMIDDDFDSYEDSKQSVLKDVFSGKRSLTNDDLKKVIDKYKSKYLG